MRHKQAFPLANGSREMKVLHFIGPDPKPFQDVRSERVDERYVGRVAAARNNDPADPRDIVARIERVPLRRRERPRSRR